MKQLELLVKLCDQALAGIDGGQVEDLLAAQVAVYGVAQGAIPVRTMADEKVLLACEYCLNELSQGEREGERAAASVIRELQRGFQAALKHGVALSEVKELVNVRA